jgi:hypothetical protein
MKARAALLRRQSRAALPFALPPYAGDGAWRTWCPLEIRERQEKLSTSCGGGAIMTPTVNESAITAFVQLVKPNGIVIAWGDGPPFQAFYFQPREIARIAKLARLNAANGRHTYWVPAEVAPEYCERLTREWAPDFRGKRTTFNPKKADCIGSYFVWLDSDPRAYVSGDVSAADHYAAERERTARPPEGLPLATVTVFSGGGHQFLWRGDKLKSPDEVERINKAIIRRAPDADHATWNVNRLLRVAGSWNPKSDDGRIPTIAELCHG